MDRWVGKTAVVTGASSGIGAAIAVSLAYAGLRVMGLARRPHLVEGLNSQVKGGGSIVSRQCDVTKLEDVTTAFQWVEETFGPVHVLVNNAGIFIEGYITDLAEGQLSDEQLISILDTNLKATVMCSRRAIASMKKHSFDGHVININSTTGHYAPSVPHFNVYPSSKHALTAFTDSLHTELAHMNSNIKLTSISPGLVDTAMVSTGHSLKLPMLRPSDVADAALYVLSTPPSVNITEITIQAIGEKKM